ncbi:MAG: delta-aminolevulinic acid dehydratase [Rhizobacter sp.]|nr:delta-aminolevulinic acid dehydratase [Chlorobiales bacterium]
MNQNELADVHKQYPIIQTSFDKLYDYCEREGWQGWDVYDGLNSRVLTATGLDQLPFARLAVIQLLKRSPVNLRPLLAVPKGFNPKGLGLFLDANVRRFERTGDEPYKRNAVWLADKLLELTTEKQTGKAYSGICWGYNFPWQARAFYQARWSPTVVATTFITAAFLEAYRVLKDEKYLDVARSASQFVVKDLQRIPNARGAGYCLSYSPHDRAEVYNASLLGSRLLARVYSHTNEPPLIEVAEASVQYCLSRQRDDGSWLYGEAGYQDWIDGFHTGFNLECLYDFIAAAGKREYEPQLQKGYAFYRNHFFTDDGDCKYYHNRLHPIDCHSVAQAVITVLKCGNDAVLAEKILLRAIETMQDADGYFYYQRTPRSINHAAYIRWTQAWMLYALSYFLHWNSSHQTSHQNGHQ